MNCRSFQELATSIARAELMDAAALEEAQQHAADCSECSVRLADHLRLTEGLELLARADEARSSATISEARLREAFRANLRNASRSDARGFPFMRLAMGIAAAAVLMFGATVLFKQDTSTEKAHLGPSVQGTPAIRVESIESRQPQTVAPVVRPDSPVLVASGNGRTHRRASIDGSHVDAQLGEFTPASYEPEETTEFVPVVQGNDPGPMSSGQVVRVTVPRSAMNYFGLPVDMDRANEKVTADVLLGDDGLARAIRFVR